MQRWFLHGWEFRPARHPPHGFGRLGAFVDGVYAIAATLLVLELRPPENVASGELGPELAQLGAQYAAYAFGFLQMVAGWLQTRRLDAWMRGVDHYATLLICASLGVYAMAPFTVAVLARSFADTDDLGSAVRLTSGLLFAALVIWAVLLLYARRVGLFRDDLDPAGFTLYFRNSLIVWVVPALAWAVSFSAPWVALAMLVGMFVLGLLPIEAHTVGEQQAAAMPDTGASGERAPDRTP